MGKINSEEGGKWKSFFRAIRTHWGLAMSRAIAMIGAERRGEFDPAEREAYLNKLLGLDAQQEHDDGVKSEFDRILGMPDDLKGDDIPFSIGRATVHSTAETQVFQGAEGSPDVIGPAAFSIGKRTAQPGAFTGGLTDVVKSTTVSHLTGQADYLAAKKMGDGAAAARVVTKVLKSAQVIAELKSRLIDDRPVVLVPVMHRDTGKRANALPKMYAEVLARATGWHVDEGMVKISGNANTNSTGVDRATNEQVFDGPVDRAVQYILVDDTMTSGDTFISQYDHIVANGGTVAAMTSLASGRYQNYLSQRQGDVSKLLDKTGLTAESFAREFGFPITQLTGSEIYRYANLEKGINSSASLRSRLFKGGIETDQQRRSSGTGSIGERQGGQISLSLGPAKVAGIMSDSALQRMTDPRRRTQVMQRISSDFNAMRLSIERMASLAGFRRTKTDMRQEANAREDLALEEKLGIIHARFGSLLADEDLTKIRQQPVHAQLADPMGISV